MKFTLSRHLDSVTGEKKLILDGRDGAAGYWKYVIINEDELGSLRDRLSFFREARMALKLGYENRPLRS